IRAARGIAGESAEERPARLKTAGSLEGRHGRPAGDRIMTPARRLRTSGGWDIENHRSEGTNPFARRNEAIRRRVRPAQVEVGRRRTPDPGHPARTRERLKDGRGTFSIS